MDQLVADFVSRMALPVAILLALRAGRMLHHLNSMNLETEVTDLAVDVLKEKIVNHLSILLRVYRDTTEDVNLPTGVNLQEVSARLLFVDERVSFLNNMYLDLLSQGTQSDSPSYTIYWRVVFLFLMVPDVL